MTSDAVGGYRQELAARLARERRWGRGSLNAALAMLGVGIVALLVGGDAAETVQGLAIILGGALAIIASRAGLSAEAVERSLAELAAMDPDPALSDADRARLRLVQTQKSLMLTRNRALNSLVYAILFVSVGAFALTYMLASLPDFLERYNATGAGGIRHMPTGEEAAWLEGYEEELLGYGFVGSAVMAWGIALLITSRSARRDADRLEVEQELMRFRTNADSALARKLFLLNGQSLDKYYDINRFNNRIAMSVSVLCIGIGVVITVWTVRLVIGTPPDQGQLIVAAVGAANTVMVNVVAAIVLRMQGTIWANFDAFHQRLVRTQELFLANVIAADLDTPEARRRSQALLSEAIAQAGQPPRRAAAPE
jgi:hypothetical protein